MRAVFGPLTAILVSILFLGVFIPLEGNAERPNLSRVNDIYTPKTIIVAQDGTGDHLTIQDGVDAASDGDTVKVYDGTYFEAVGIMRSINLIGNGTTKTILDGKGTLDHQHLFQVSASNVNITGFHFTKGSPHHEFAGIGIYAPKVYVYDNHFSYNTNGIYIASGPGILVHNNTFDINYRGIRSDMGCDKNSILDNKFTNNTSVGVLYLGANNVTILRNHFSKNAYHMGLFNSHYYNVGHNVLISSDPGRSSVVMATATYNKVHNNTYRNNDFALSLSTGADSNIIERNKFIGNLEGIKAFGDVKLNEVHFNSFINNSLFGMNFSSSAYTINATLNWWGNYSGPYDPISNPSGNGDSVTVNVTYSPWLLGEFENRPPKLEPIADIQVQEDSIVIIELNASDPDGQNIRFSMETDASWLTLNTTTLNISGSPDNLDVGAYNVLINITDGWGAYDEIDFLIEVLNTPPSIHTLYLPNATEDMDYLAVIEHTDEIGAHWNMTTDAAWLEMDPIISFLKGKPGNDDVGSYFVHLNYSDGNGGFHAVNYTLNVTNVDDLPFIDVPLENLEFLEDTKFRLDLEEWIFDPDDEIGNYSFRGNGNLTVTFDEENRTALIVPLENWCGYDIGRFSAHAGEVQVHQSIMIEVIQVNDAPFDPSIEISDGFKLENETFFLNGSANDPDLIYGDMLEYTWYSSISGNIGTGSSIIIDLPSGNHTILLKVEDKVMLSVSTSIVLYVHPPVIMDDNDTTPVNDTDDNNTIPDDDQDQDDNTTVPDDNDQEPDDDTTAPDDDDVVIGDDDEVRDTDYNLDIALMLTAIILILLMGMVIFFIFTRSRNDENWEIEE